MSHFRLHTKGKERNYYLLAGAVCVLLAAVVAGYVAHSIGTARAKSRETVLLYTEEELEQYLLDTESEDYNLNGNYRLEEDMDLGWLEYSIGTNMEPFTGRFDGNGHVISNLRRPLFGVLEEAEVENLFLNGAMITCPFTYHDGERYVDGYGALAAYAIDSKIRNCGMNGEIHTASPAEAEYQLEKASPSEADERKGQGVGTLEGSSQVAGDGMDGPGDNSSKEEGEFGPGTSIEVGEDNETAGIETETESGTKAETGLGIETGTESGSGAEAGTEAGNGAETGTEAGNGAETGTEAGSGEESGTEAGSGEETGTEAGSGEETGTESGNGAETGTEAEIEAGTKEESGVVIEVEKETDRKAETGIGGGPETELGTGVSSEMLGRTERAVASDAALPAETAGYRSTVRQHLMMKASAVMEPGVEEPLEASPSDAIPSTTAPLENPPSKGTPSDAEKPLEEGWNTEEIEYIGNPDGDIYILVVAERVTAGGLIAQTEGETFISDSFTLTTIGSLLKETESYAGGISGIIGNETRVENSYAAGLVDGDGVTGGFVAVNEGMIENCYSTVTVGKNGISPSAFAALGDGTMSGCAYDRQMACAGDYHAEVFTEEEQTGEEWTSGLKALRTKDMTGMENEIAGNWRKTDNAYPQLEYFALHEQETVAATSRASAIALFLPEELTLSDVVKNGELVLPSEIDGVEIIWEAEGNVKINEKNQVISGENPIPSIEANEIPNVGTALESTSVLTGTDTNLPEESSKEIQADLESVIQEENGTKEVGGSAGNQLKASVENITRNFPIAVMEADMTTYADWGKVGEAVDGGKISGVSPPEFNEADNCYEIGSEEQLAWFAYKVNSGEIDINGRVMANLDMTGIDYGGTSGTPLSWVPIASEPSGYTYIGTFDGGYYAIDNLRYVTSANESGAGLIGWIGGDGEKNATIRGVHIRKNCYFEALNYAAGVVGGVRNAKSVATVTECMNEGTVRSRDSHAGGIVGGVSSGTLNLSNCGNLGSVGGVGNTGGLIGWFNSASNKNHRVVNSYSINSGAKYALGASATSGVVYNSNNYYVSGEFYRGITGTKLTDAQMRSWAFAYLLNGKRVDGTWVGKSGGYPVPEGSSEKPLHTWEDIGQGMAWGWLAEAVPSGTGNSDDPYQITNAAQLGWFAYQVNSGTKTNACAKLLNDIDLCGDNYGWSAENPIRWNPVGTSAKPYTGTFDGNGKLISYMKVEHDGAAGLFGYAGGGAVIENVGLAQSGNIKNISADGAAAEVGTAAFVGSVKSNGTSAGITIQNCYNRASVAGITGSKTGAFVGICDTAGDSKQKITNSYTTGLITAVTGTPGAIAGNFAPFNPSTGVGIQYCYWDSDTSAVNGTLDAVSGGGVAVKEAESKTSREMNTDVAETTGGLVEQLNTDADSGSITGPWKRIEHMNDEYPILTTGYDSWAYIGKDRSAPSCKTPSNIGKDPAGTVTNPYLIQTEEDLAWFAYQVNSNEADSTGICAELMADLNLFGEIYTGSMYNPASPDLSKALNWIPIGDAAHEYKGTFQGNGHMITCMRADGIVDQGLFGVLGAGASISDIRLSTNLLVSTEGNAGGIAGDITGNGVTVKACRNTGLLTGTAPGSNNAVGGIVGAVTGSGVTITSCWNEGAIVAEASPSGGIVGKAHQAEGLVIEGCYTTGGSSISAAGFEIVGGILGHMSGASQEMTVRNCYNQGNATGASQVGGIVGVTTGNSGLLIQGCYNTNSLVSSGSKGNIVGAKNAQASVINCFSDQKAEAGSSGEDGTQIETAELKTWAAAYALNGQKYSQAPDSELSWIYNSSSAIANGYPMLTAGADGLVPADWEKVGEGLELGLITPAGWVKPNTSVTTGTSADGSSGAPYQLENAEDLAWFAYQVNREPASNSGLCADLTQYNIDFTGTAYGGTAETPIAWIPIKTYSGTFGAGNTSICELSRLRIGTAADSTVNTGLFEMITGTAAKIAVVDSTLKSSGGSQGAIAGVLDGGTIYQCYSRNNVGDGARNVGGIAGRLTGAGAEIYDCYNLESQLEAAGADSVAGGIAGDGSSGTIQNCYNACLDSGFIKADELAGGTAGSIAGKTGGGNLIQCYSDQTLSDSGQITVFDTASDEKRLEQTAGLNTYNGVEREGAGRVWYTSLVDEKTKGFPTLTPPVILTVAVDPAKVTEMDGTVTGAIGEVTGGTLPSALLFRRIRHVKAAEEPEVFLKSKEEVTGSFHTYGTANAHTNLAFTAGNTDIAGLSGSLTNPNASIGNVLTLYNGASYIYPYKRTMILELAEKTLTGGTTEVTRYEVTVEIAAVTGKTLDITMKTPVTIELQPGVTGTAYTEDLELANQNPYPLQMNISHLETIKEGKDVVLQPIAGEIHDENPLTEDGIKMGITKPAEGDDTGNLGTTGDLYYQPPEAEGEPGSWMKGSLGYGGTLRYRYFINHSLLHIGPEQTFGFKITYEFQIPSKDQNPGVSVSAG